MASRIRRVVTSLGVLPIVFPVWRAVREWTPALAVRNARLRRNARKSIPVPPGRLLFSATGSRNVEWFLQSADATAASFLRALDAIGRPLCSFEKVLELGCGCGRVLREWECVRGPRFYGTDYNPAGINWGRKYLPFATLGINELQPPLAYDDSSFDLCYSVSVFTHLPEALQEPWLAELHRVLCPGGILLVTLSGTGDLVRVAEQERTQFNAGNLVVVDDQYAGTNMCGVYHPQSYVRAHWTQYFEILAFYSQGAGGVPLQDLYVLRKVQRLKP